MPDIWMDVDAALAEVPVNILPLIDDTDFKSREVAVAYNQAGMDLVWNFVTTAGAFTQTAVTPTTGGAYDWAHQGDGMYSIEIPASGGGDINNDTEGFGWFTGFCTGVLPWRGPTIGFRAAGLNNLLIDSAHSATRGLAGTAVPDAAADAAGGLAISDAGGLDLDTKLAETHEITAARMGALTDWINAGRLDAILDLIKTAVDAVQAKTDNLPADPADDSDIDTQLAAIAGYIDAEVAAIKTVVDAIQAVTDALPDAGALSDLAAILTDTGTTLPATLATIAGYLDTEIAAIKAVTDALPDAGALSDLAAILTDTETTLPATLATIAGYLDTEIAAIKAVTDALPDAGALSDLAAILTDTGTTLPGTLVTIAGYLDSEIAAILADTGELQTDLTDGGRLDLLLDAIKAKTDVLPASPTKNAALSDIPFPMVLSSDHVTPATGKTVVVEISKDGGAFAAVDGAITEISAGWYKVDLTQTEMNADTIAFKATETDCDQTNILFVTSG